jgi:hypothetical protein
MTDIVDKTLRLYNAISPAIHADDGHRRQDAPPLQCHGCALRRAAFVDLDVPLWREDPACLHLCRQGHLGIPRASLQLHWI